MPAADLDAVLCEFKSTILLEEREGHLAVKFPNELQPIRKPRRLLIVAIFIYSREMSSVIGFACTIGN